MHLLTFIVDDFFFCFFFFVLNSFLSVSVMCFDEQQNSEYLGQSVRTYRKNDDDDEESMPDFRDALFAI